MKARMWLAMGALAAGAWLGAGQAKPPAEPIAASQPARGAAATQGASVRVLTLSVIANADYSRLAPIQAPDYSESPKPGLKLAFSIECPKGDVLEVLGYMTKSFTDDLGTDLGSGEVPDEIGENRPPYNLTREVDSADAGNAPGRGLVIQMASKQVPAAGATSVKIKGSASLRVGVGIKEFKAQALVMRLGRTIATDSGTLKVVQLQERRYADSDGLMVDLLGTGDMGRLKTVKVAGADGAPLKSYVTVSRNRGQCYVQLQLTTLVSAIIVTPVIYDEIKTVQVPVDLTVGVGMPAWRKENP